MSENYGIATNINIVKTYINNLFIFIQKNYNEEFFKNINTNFGFAPTKRLKLIHGYDTF